MEAAGLLEKVEPHRHVVPYGDRGGVPIEPYLTDQWFVDAATLEKPAIEAVEQGRTRFVPENWTKNYFEWRRNNKTWCRSRQLREDERRTGIRGGRQGKFRWVQNR